MIYQHLNIHFSSPVHPSPDKLSRQNSQTVPISTKRLSLLDLCTYFYRDHTCCPLLLLTAASQVTSPAIPFGPPHGQSLPAPSKRQDDAPRLSERGRLPALEGVQPKPCPVSRQVSYRIESWSPSGRLVALWRVDAVSSIGFRIVEGPGMRAGRRIVVWFYLSIGLRFVGMVISTLLCWYLVPICECNIGGGMIAMLWLSGTTASDESNDTTNYIVIYISLIPPKLE